LTPRGDHGILRKSRGLAHAEQDGIAEFDAKLSGERFIQGYGIAKKICHLGPAAYLPNLIRNSKNIDMISARRSVFGRGGCRRSEKCDRGGRLIHGDGGMLGRGGSEKLRL